MAVPWGLELEVGNLFVQELHLPGDMSHRRLLMLVYPMVLAYTCTVDSTLVLVVRCSRVLCHTDV